MMILQCTGLLDTGFTIGPTNGQRVAAALPGMLQLCNRLMAAVGILIDVIAVQQATSIAGNKKPRHLAVAGF